MFLVADDIELDVSSPISKPLMITNYLVYLCEVLRFCRLKGHHNQTNMTFNDQNCFLILVGSILTLLPSGQSSSFDMNAVQQTSD